MKGFNIHLFIIGRDLGTKTLRGVSISGHTPKACSLKMEELLRPHFSWLRLNKNTLCNGEWRQLGTQAPSFPGKHSTVLKFTWVLDFVSWLSVSYKAVSDTEQD